MKDRETQYIYSLEFPKGNVRYIGKTFNPLQRYKKHIKDSAKSTASHKMAWINGLIQKGELPDMNIIDTVSMSEVNFWEEHYIWLYMSWGFKLTNSTFGGDGLSNPTKDIKEKIQATLKQTYADGYKAWNDGIEYTDEYKEKLRNSAKNRRKPILQYDMGGNFIQKHESLREAIRNNDNFDKGALGRTCSCKADVHSYKGFLWAYEHLISNGTVTPQGLVEKHYTAHNTNKRDKFPTFIDVETQKIISQWRSLSVAAAELGVSKSKVADNIRNRVFYGNSIMVYGSEIQSKTLPTLCEELKELHNKDVILQLNPIDGKVINKFHKNSIPKHIDANGRRIARCANLKGYGTGGFIWVKEYLLKSEKTTVKELLFNYKYKIVKIK